MRHLTTLLLLFASLLARPAVALTWDEPWHEQVVKKADSFVLAKITASTGKGITATIIRTLGGRGLSGTIRITGFYLLDICSSSGGHGPEFYTGNADTCYFFLQQNTKGNYSIATPSTGFAAVKKANVVATYRHSYHQALVPQSVYEPTMTAIFRHYHGQEYDHASLARFLASALALPPARIDEAGMHTFFLQHVALETIYHVGLSKYYEQVLPFLHDTANFHARVSAARALTASNTPAAKQQLLQLLRDKDSGDFTKVIALQTLARYQPHELKPELTKLAAQASDESNGFGGNIMDPRVCTHLPTVKAAMTKLAESL
ncbi:HEAT repeat domain-containing protein [Hymenobacter rubidus]|uniref:HEAT repeat domain-containing protein n=1 Tax=Hymenobacter rubidus TaxID=1441626 RepID=UPI00191F9706|nr:HEAT repeat domain-containing protein [Hymenobacter rubidus]